MPIEGEELPSTWQRYDPSHPRGKGCCHPSCGLRSWLKPGPITLELRVCPLGILLWWEMGVAGRADGNLGSDIPVSCGKRSWVSVSKSSPGSAHSSSQQKSLVQGLMDHLTSGWIPPLKPCEPFACLGLCRES